MSHHKKMSVYNWTRLNDEWPLQRVTQKHFPVFLPAKPNNVSLSKYWSMKPVKTNKPGSAQVKSFQINCLPADNLKIPQAPDGLGALSKLKTDVFIQLEMWGVEDDKNQNLNDSTRQMCVCVPQGLLTTWHAGRLRWGRADAATQLTISGKSSWKTAMVLQHRESETHECRKHAVVDMTRKGKEEGRTYCVTCWPMTALFMPWDNKRGFLSLVWCDISLLHRI